MKYREDDSRDILGTYQAILESKQSPIVHASAEDECGDPGKPIRTLP